MGCMEFCEELNVLLSSLQWADKFPASGLCSFTAENLKEPAYVALIETLDEICNGLVQDNTVQERNRWSSTLTRIFTWKWLLSKSEFKFLEKDAPSNLRRFPEFNLNFCYEIIKKQNWIELFCDFVLSLGLETSGQIIHNLCEGTFLASSEMKVEDCQLFVRFANKVLSSLFGQEISKKHPGSEINTMKGIFKKLFEVFGKIFIQEENGRDFPRNLLLILTFLNVLLALLNDSIVGVDPSSLIVQFTNDYVSNVCLGRSDDLNVADIMAYDVVIKSLHDIGDVGRTEVESVASETSVVEVVNLLTKFVEKNWKIIEENLKMALEELKESKKSTFSGFCVMDTNLEIFVCLVNHVKEYLINTSFQFSRQLEKILQIFEPVCNCAVEIVRFKRNEAGTNLFKLETNLTSLRLESIDRRESFPAIFEYCEGDVEVIKKQIKCARDNIDLFDDADSFVIIYRFTTRLLENRVVAYDGDDFLNLERILLDIFMKLDWPTKDEIIYRLNSVEFSQNYHKNIFKISGKFDSMWKPYLNRLSNSDKEDKNEMLKLLSVFLLADVENLLAKIFKEISLDGQIVEAVVTMLSHFPKIFKIKSRHGNASVFCLSFVTYFFADKSRGLYKKETNLLKLIKFLLQQNESIKGKPLLNSEDFITSCILPTLEKSNFDSTSDLMMVELFLVTLQYKSSRVEMFTFFYIFVYVCDTLERIYNTNMLVETKNSEKEISNDFVLSRKNFLLNILKMWQEIYKSSFSKDKKLRELISTKLSRYDWLTQSYFLGCFDNDVVLSQTLRCLLFSPVPTCNEAAWRVGGIQDLFDFCGISDDCLQYALENVNLKLLTEGDGICNSSSVHGVLLTTFCQKLPVSTEEEWMRLCKLLLHIYGIDEIKTSQLLYEAFVLLRLLESRKEFGLWNCFPWNKCCQNFLNFLEVFILKKSVCKENHRKVMVFKTCIELYNCAASPYIVNFLRQFILF